MYSQDSLVDKIFVVLMERPTLSGMMSLAVMIEAVAFHSRASRVVWPCFQTLHSELTFDGFEDILDRELQRGEAVIHLVGSE